MALIKCPECGEQVSTSASQCVHCGCTYTVCPECGKIHVGAFAVCPECGFQIKTQKTPFAPSKRNAENVNNAYGTNVVDIWQKRSATDKIVLRTIKIAHIALYALCIFFLVIAAIIVETWDTGSAWNDIWESNVSLGGLNKAVNGIYDNSHGLIAGACIVFALAPLVKELGLLYSQVVCGMWLKKHEIDVVPYVKKLSGQLEFNDLPKEWDYENFSSAAYISVVPHDKNIKIAKYIYSAVCIILIAVCGGVFLTQIIDELIKLKINDNYDFVFHFDALIATVVFVIAYIVGIIVFERKFNNRKEVWLQSL